ncbi:hypothetical protein SEVIR_7G296906v4 [Setaria viridis]|uniref:DUF6598 domain-containing protein n=1 Tax=Setaria viridis TaxID=4556 RepID=A0A4U6U1Z3_SETVI|nr:uncharacterized protein LOC117865933 [Setaria viridis]TKW07299.1 hypothetical protein SEVIR_7G296906v2 [Setaria viridis]
MDLEAKLGENGHGHKRSDLDLEAKLGENGHGHKRSDLDLEAKLGENGHGHKRSGLDLEKAEGQVLQGGDAKRPREANNGDHRSAMETDEEEEEEEELGPERCFELHRNSWLWMFGNNGAIPFEAETQYPPMRYTDIPVLPVTGGSGSGDTMEVFFVKVTQITSDLQWPLDVYGIVAVRDSLDRKRIYLFRRGRDNCQTLTSQDSLLQLTGPSRAIVLWDEPVFEIDLKVKDKGSSLSEDDKILCLDFFGYNNISYRGNLSYTRTRVLSSKHSTVEVRYAHVKRSVEATITARISKGSGNFSARLTACNTSIGEDVVLLDTRGKEVEVNKDGQVTLQRRVVVVEEGAELILGIKAEQLGDAGESSTKLEKFGFVAKSARSDEGYFHIGSSSLHMVVAWSVLL